MHQRVRCPHCHHWTDALLVWAAGDCCPSCNTPMSGLARTIADEDERPLRPPPDLSRSRPDRFYGATRIPRHI